MAKRFTDSEKWQDEWWGSLANDYRMIWLYLVDRCSPAGIWKKDFRGLNFNCNTSVTEEQFKEVFKERIVDRGNFYFLPKFLRFQYPKGLNSGKPAIVSIRKEIQLNNLYPIVRQSLGNGFLTIKDMDKDKDKDKVKDKDKDNGQGQKPGANNFEETWKVAFDEQTTTPLIMQFKDIDVANELMLFRLKCNNDKADYHNRDVAGLRQAFLYQLKNSKGANGLKKQILKGADLTNL